MTLWNPLNRAKKPEPEPVVASSRANDDVYDFIMNCQAAETAAREKATAAREEADSVLPKPKYNAAPFSVSIIEQLEGLDEDLARVCVRLGRLGLAIRDDGTEITEPIPPVVTLQDSSEFINTRVDFMNLLIDSLEVKLGF